MQISNYYTVCSFISLEIDCFHINEYENICIAGLNRRAGYATVDNTDTALRKMWCCIIRFLVES